jgi:hypothetical protein
MDIQFDPFSFVVATFALAIAVVQLYWNRSQHRAQVCLALNRASGTYSSLAIQVVEELHVLHGQA